MRIFGLGCLEADAAGDFDDDKFPFPLSAFNDAIWLLVEVVGHGDFLLFLLLLALAFGMDVTLTGDDCAVRLLPLIDFFPLFAEFLVVGSLILLASS